MVNAFCGHSKYIQNTEDEKRILEILKNKVGDTPSEFFLGEYGAFDLFAYNCAKKFQESNPHAKLIFITPYLSVQYKKNQPEHVQNRFDLVIYPELENVPPRYAISRRNRWIVEHADIIIAYITHKYGGAYTMYEYAKRKNKEVYNIAPQKID